MQKIQEYAMDEDRRIESHFQKFIGLMLPTAYYEVTKEKIKSFSQAVMYEKLENELMERDNGFSEKDFIENAPIKPHPSFPSCFTIRPLFQLKHVRDTDGSRPFRDERKTLHLSHRFDYKNCIPIEPGQTIKTTLVISDITCKKGNLWISFSLNSTTMDDRPVVKTEVQFMVKRRGYRWKQ